MANLITDDIDLLEFIANQESQDLCPASDWTQQVLDRIAGKGGTKGDVMPWSKTQNLFAMRPGEVSLWGGINGHGKSQFLGQVCLWGLKDARWLIASMEMKPAVTLHRQVRQAAGTNSPSDDFTTGLMRWTDNRLWIYDQQDTVSHERILGAVHYAAKMLGVNHIIIDSLMKCGFKGGRDKILGEQEAFVDRLCWAAKTYNIHIHLVHHMRKGDSEETIPGKFDFKNSGGITDLVDNVLIVHRNKAKEVKLRRGEFVEPSTPDCHLRICKQRNGEWEGDFKFWFHQASLQYTPKEDNRPMPFMFENQPLDGDCHHEGAGGYGNGF